MDDLIIIKVDDLKKMIEDIVEAETTVILEAIKEIQQPKPEKLLTKKEAAAFLRVSIPTIDNYRRQNKLKSINVGGIKFKLSDLMALLK